MNQKLTIEKFLDFQQQLQREILSLEVRGDQSNSDLPQRTATNSILFVFAYCTFVYFCLV